MTPVNAPALARGASDRPPRTARRGQAHHRKHAGGSGGRHYQWFCHRMRRPVEQRRRGNRLSRRNAGSPNRCVRRDQRQEFGRDRQNSHQGLGDTAGDITSFSKVVAGRTPVICELKKPRRRRLARRRPGRRARRLICRSAGVEELRPRSRRLFAAAPSAHPARGLCPIGIVAEASYDDPIWAFLTAEQKREWTDFDHFDRIRPDFLSWNVDDLPHKIPFLVKELHGAPVMAWTVRTAEEARGGPEMGGPDRVRGRWEAVKLTRRRRAPSRALAGLRERRAPCATRIACPIGRA